MAAYTSISERVLYIVCFSTEKAVNVAAPNGNTVTVMLPAAIILTNKEKAFVAAEGISGHTVGNFWQLLLKGYSGYGKPSPICRKGNNPLTCGDPH